jgi:hypothetical protein
MLYTYGFMDVWENQGCVCHKSFISKFKQRVIGNLSQNWLSDINDKPVLNLYNNLKRIWL